MIANQQPDLSKFVCLIVDPATPVNMLDESNSHAGGHPHWTLSSLGDRVLRMGDLNGFQDSLSVARSKCERQAAWNQGVATMVGHVSGRTALPPSCLDATPVWSTSLSAMAGFEGSYMYEVSPTGRTELTIVSSAVDLDT